MNRTLLAVLAHPDDESYGLGGTLARYAAEGVDVHVAIATDGAAGSIDEKWEGDRSRLTEARAQELRVATDVLGVHLHMMDYRDSGYIGDPVNEHPQAFINADEVEVIGKVVGLIREFQPQVVITHDETGGYFHPDHIFCNTITTAAFFASGQEDKYPDIHPKPFQPQKLFFSAFSNRWVKMTVLLMRLRGKDPTRSGRNQDIDITKLGVEPGRITATIDYREFWGTKTKASAAHGSQGGGTSFSRLLPFGLQRHFLSKETFIQAYPAPSPGAREKDLFVGIP